MEKFLLRTFLTDDKLDIIDQKDIVIPVFFSEFRCGYIVFISDRIDQFIGKLLACDIQNFGLRIILENKMADGVHKMSFAKTNSSIYKKRVVYFTWRFGDSQRSRMRQIIVGTYDETVKRISGI